jgi:cob(I)alamin adenosyltransferase
MGKSKIYTGKGDGGLTSLVGGKRVQKYSARVEAYGTIDELNAFIACLIEETDEPNDKNFLSNIRSELFDVGSYLASQPGQLPCKIDEDTIVGMEKEMDTIDEILPDVRFFILPGGCRANATANVCRTVCRRAERAICQLNDIEKVDENILKYINRLSDYFFLLGRKYNLLKKNNEKFWENHP